MNKTLSLSTNIFRTFFCNPITKHILTILFYRCLHLPEGLNIDYSLREELNIVYQAPFFLNLRQVSYKTYAVIQKHR